MLEVHRPVAPLGEPVSMAPSSLRLFCRIEDAGIVIFIYSGVSGDTEDVSRRGKLLLYY